MPKAPRSSAIESQRHNPLAEDYSPINGLKQKTPKRRKSRAADDAAEFIDNRASRRILSLGQDLADEEERETQQLRPASTNDAFALESRLIPESQSEDEDVAQDTEEQWMDEQEEESVDIEDMNPQDLALFNQFNPPTFDDPILRPGDDPDEHAGQSRNLADIILAKIAEQEAANSGRPDIEDHPLEDQGPVELPPKVVEVYSKIGLILSRYKSGKLPKAFKIIPTLPPAMQAAVVELTRPEKWTPHAVYAATRIFVSATSVTAQQFLQSVVLDAVREDIYENKKLNVHLYNALKKSMYKPAAFFKGILFPILQSGTATLREAAILASVVTRVSVPVLHSAAALTRCCDIAAEQMAHNVEAAGATNLVIKALLEKRYALPYQTIDALVFHFIRFRPQQQDTDMGGSGNGADRDAEYGKLPVIWHQCLLAFAQRYRDEISEEQREALLDLLLMRGHNAIGPEIRKELLAGRGRGVTIQQDMSALGDGGDDTLMAVA